jgi:site-specific DNA recombinase
MTQKIPHAALYVRVSTGNLGESQQTVSQQEMPLIEHCKAQGWTFEIFREFASGAKESRPQLDSMLQRIRKKEFDILMVLRLDRLGRSLQHLLQLVEEMKNLKVRIIFLTQGIDTSTAQGMFFLQLIGAMAQFERELIKERINDKLNYIDKTIEKDGFYISKAGNKLTKRGRHAGSKDKNPRRKSGYWLRWQKDKEKNNLGTSAN